MNNKYFEMYSKRINNLNVIIICISLYILSNFFYLQIFDHPELSSQINKDSIKTRTSIGERGKILDRNKNELAVTTNKYDFWVNTYKKFDKEKIASLFAEVFNSYWDVPDDLMKHYNKVGWPAPDSTELEDLEWRPAESFKAEYHQGIPPRCRCGNSKVTAKGQWHVIDGGKIVACWQCAFKR